MTSAIDMSCAMLKDWEWLGDKANVLHECVKLSVEYD